mmetsp:Transcript_5374/g.13048  ORF Transcript_5374/g.13048 Transcript_5374/m.13048 type:complete len:80 (+) Transcript_5374:210-449(+)
MTACRPLFDLAFRRGEGACIHSHSLNTVLATMICKDRVFRCSHLEMVKGMRGHGYTDVLEVPIIANTSHEEELEASMQG